MSFHKVLISFGLLFLILFLSMVTFGLGPHKSLSLCVLFLAFISKLNGVSFKGIFLGLMNGLKQGLSPMLVLGMIGVVVASWNLSGTLPTLLSYGLDLFSPKWFLVSSLFLCIVVSTFTGSSLITCATVGAALMGVGRGLGIDPAVLAGAVISGAFFGDKMSPLSDTTNFAPGICGVNIYDHIKSISVTTIPAIILSFLFFLYMGQGASVGDTLKLKAIQEALQSSFVLSWVTLVPAFFVLLLAFLRKPILFVLLCGVVTAFFVSLFVQKNFSSYEWLIAMYRGVNLPISQKEVAWIINRGGVSSMFYTISLVFISLMLGGLLQCSGLLGVLQEKLNALSFRKKGFNILTTFSCAFVNLLTGEQYLSILIPGQLFKGIYERLKISKLYLTRALEDGGTLINPLVPWGVCGVFIAGQLGVPVVDYLPYAVFLYLCPLFNLFFALCR